MDPWLIGFGALQAGGAVTAVSGLVYGIWTIRKRSAEAMAEAWREAAAPLGLAVRAGGGLSSRWVRLRGEHAGRAVRAHFAISGNAAYASRFDVEAWGGLGNTGPNHLGITEVSVQVGAPLPAGLHIRQESAASETLRYMGIQDVQLGDEALDSALHVSCDAPERLRQLVGTPAGLRAVQLLARTPGLSIRKGAVHQESEAERPEALAGTLRALAALCQDLEAAMRGGLSGLAGARAGVVEGEAVVGTTGGISWRAAISASGGEVRVQLVDGGPAGLCIVPPGGDPPEGRPVSLPNPILGRLVTIRAADPDEVVARLDEAATEAVLAVVRGHAGARVVDGAVVVPVDDVFDPDAFAGALDDALRLAMALRAG